MNIIPIPAFLDNYIWVITDIQNGTFDCVDPGDATPILHFAQQTQLKLRTILLTHHHNDHIGGVAQLIKVYPSCLIYGPEDPRIPYITNPVKENQKINVGSYSFLVLFNPGHTSTHISYYEPVQNWLFCGDTLFSAGCGRVFDGTMEQLHQSLLMFKKLPPQTKVFCAHEYTLQNLKFAQAIEPKNKMVAEYATLLAAQPAVCSLPSSIDKELLINPFFRTETPDVQQYALNNGAISPSSLEIFRVLRNQKNAFK